MANIWLPDYPPASASAYDDEFSDGSLSGWTEFDPDSILTVSEGDAGLKLTTTGATWGYANVYKAIPAASDFAIWTKVGVHALAVQYFDAGLFIAQDLSANPTTADFISINWRYGDSALKIFAGYWSAYNTGVITPIASATDAVIPTDLYLRLRWINSSHTTIADYSTDGVGWQQLYSNTSLTSPAYFGVGMSNYTGATRSADFAFFRCVVATPALTDVMSGRRIDPDNPPVDGSPWYYYAQM